LAQQASEALLTLRLNPYNVLCRLFLPGLQNSSRKFAFAQAAVNLARTGVALEQHRLAQGEYPQTLEALAPRFINRVPQDPIGGQPFRYRLTQDKHFILYSLGWNGKDDGGSAALNKSGSVDLDNGDWVWRYPQAPES
jgi:hypothetical protein